MKRTILRCAAGLLMAAALLPTALAAEPFPEAPEVQVCYPTSVTRSEDGTEIRKVYDLSVVPLVTLYYVVQQLFKVPLADVCGALDGLFDSIQADAVGAKRPDVLHRDFVQLASQFQPGAYLVK